MNDITVIHQEVLDHLIELRKTNPKLFFVPRLVNRKSRLDKGYWFIGNEEYLVLSFWKGRDSVDKIHSIGFVIDKYGRSSYGLSARDSAKKILFMKKIMQKISGFEQCGKRKKKDKWKKDYYGTDYIKNLDDFIKNVKPIIDVMVITEKPEGITIPNQEFFDKYGGRVIGLRNQ